MALSNCSSVGTHFDLLPGPLPRVPAEDVAVAGLDEDVVAPDVVQDLVGRRRGQVGQGVTLRLRTKNEKRCC